MRTSIFSILIALTVLAVAPLGFAEQDQIAEQETVVSETLVETEEAVDTSRLRIRWALKTPQRTAQTVLMMTATKK